MLASSSLTAGPSMKCWLSHTFSIAAWISAAMDKYCGVRASSGTCMGELVFASVTAMGQLRLRVLDGAVILSALISVVFAEPLDELSDPHFDRRRGPVPHVPDEVIDVGVGLVHVAGLQRQEVLHRLAPEAVLDDLDVAQQLHRLTVADVVEPKRRRARGRVGSLAVPARIRLRDALRGPHYSLGDVIDIGEVAPVVSVVEHIDRLAFEDVAREEEERHVGAPPRSVHREETQPRGRHLEER